MAGRQGGLWGIVGALRGDLAGGGGLAEAAKLGDLFPRYCGKSAWPLKLRKIRAGRECRAYFACGRCLQTELFHFNNLWAIVTTVSPSKYYARPCSRVPTLPPPTPRILDVTWGLKSKGGRCLPKPYTGEANMAANRWGLYLFIISSMPMAAVFPRPPAADKLS
jgi:hypothetical protein